MSAKPFSSLLLTVLIFLVMMLTLGNASVAMAASAESAPIAANEADEDPPTEEKSDDEDGKEKSTKGGPGDVWVILAPIQDLFSFIIRLMIGLVGLSFAFGTYKNAAVANVAHNLSMSHPAAGAVFNLLIGLAYFAAFWIIPGIVQQMYGQIVTQDAMNQMSDLNWIQKVGQ